MSMDIQQIINEPSQRNTSFPVTGQQTFLAHAGVAPLPAAARDGMHEFADRGAVQRQENPWLAEQMKQARRLGAQIIGAKPQEIALLGPTSLGLSLVALGLDWHRGDQVIYYRDDYPANVYPWLNLARQGVEPTPLTTQPVGRITWDDIEPLLTDRTRLVSLASCNFVSGYRIDVPEIGRRLHERGILFCVDAIQTVGAFPMDVEHVDFLAADSHKWMLGPVGAGIVYVSEQQQDNLRPTILGSLNVVSPRFIAQDSIAFESGAQRYEAGAPNGPGIVGMAASLEVLLEVGVKNIAARLLELRRYAIEQLGTLGFQPYLQSIEADMPDSARSGIISFTHPQRNLEEDEQRLREANVFVSLRHDRAGTPILRLSPHFYNTFEDIDRIVEVLSNGD